MPLNLFGGYNLATGQGSITPDMAKYVLYEDHTVTQEVMRDYTANLSGELFDLPAGPLGMAVGAESLEHDAFSHPDALTQEGNTSGNVTYNVKGEKEVVIDVAALHGKGYPAPVNPSPAPAPSPARPG